MKRFKFLYLSFIAFITVSISVNAQSTNKFFAKKGKLSETQLERWSNLDLAQDSIPGMSVDKAYDQLLKYKKGKRAPTKVAQ